MLLQYHCLEESTDYDILFSKWEFVVQEADKGRISKLQNQNLFLRFDLSRFCQISSDKFRFS